MSNQLYKFLRDRNIANTFAANCIKYSIGILSFEHDDTSYIIDTVEAECGRQSFEQAFDWESTGQGHDFWFHLSEDWKDEYEEDRDFNIKLDF